MAASAGVPLTIAVLSDTGYLFFFLCLALQPFVVVSVVVHHRNLNKVLGERRGLNLPFEAGRLPWIVAGDFAVPQRPGKVEERQQISHAEDRRSRGRKKVQDLELGR